MKVMFFPVYALTPEVEREAELALRHLENGDEVFIVRCSGQLPSCLNNVRHQRSVCTYCVAKYRAGQRAGGIPDSCMLDMPPVPREGYPDLRFDFADIDELTAYTWRGVDIGAAVASHLIWHANMDHRFDPRRYADMVRRDLIAAAHMFESARAQMERIRPDRVYVVNGRHSTTRTVIRAAERAGVEWWVHERVQGYDRYFLARRQTVHDIPASGREMVALWEAADPGERERIGASFYTERRNRSEQGWFSYARQMEHNRLPAGFDPTRRNVVVFNSTMQEMVGLEGWDNWIYRDDNDALRRVFKELAADPDIRVTLRMHPNLNLHTTPVHAGNNTQLRELEEMKAAFPHVDFIDPGSKVDSYALIDAASVVLVTSSTVGAEACYWGKTTITCGAPAIYQPVGCVHQPASHEELMAWIRNPPPPRPRQEALMYGFWEMTRGTPYVNTRQTGVFQATLNGVRVHPTRGDMARVALRRAWEMRNPSEWPHAIAEFRKYLRDHRPSS